jgi:4-amino-4-deoxy-L-arabinose transferase-like glycosyltransferase
MALTTQIDETSARLPFALMGIAAIAAIALAGRRMAGASSAGLVAALLVALDGYLIAFSRVMHYESVVVLNSLLALLLMHRVLRRTRTGSAAATVRGELYLLALLVATGVAAHYDGVVVLLPLGLLVLSGGWTPSQWWRAAWAPALLGLGLLLAFYVPFFTSPEFQATLAFYRESLVEGSAGAGGVNHLGYLAESFLFYNGGAKTALLLILTAGVMVRWLWRPSLPVYRLAALLLLGGLLLQLWAPERLVVAGMAVAPWLILLTGVLLIAAPRQPAMIRAWWLWFFLPFVVAMFVVQEPGLHFYYFFVPWFLLLGEGWAALEQVAARRVAHRTVVAGSVLLWGALTIVAGTASYRFFLAPDASVLTYKEAWRPPTWWPMQTRQYDHFLYGIANPSGWKGIGVLLAGGELEMPLATNVDRWTADWYSRGAEYCRPDPALAAIDVTSKQERGAGMIAALEGSLQPVGAIQRGGAPVIELFGRGEPRIAVAVEALDPLFDRWLSPASALALTPETALPLSPLNAIWGDQVAATGFLVQQLTGIDAPSLALTVQWTALARPAADYAAELLLVDPSDPNRVAGRRLVALSCSAGAAGGWKAGKAATGYYRIAVDPAAAGVYDVRLRLVDPASGTPLPVRAGAPVLPGDQLTLTQVTFNR